MTEVKDLKPGMLLEGTVSNVAQFGAFVDLGVHQDGLIHVSQLSHKFVRDAREVVRAGQVVKVRALASSDQSLKLNIVYLNSVVSKRIGNRVLTIQYNPSMGQYQMLDENGRPVRSAHVSTQRNFVGVAVGVAAISTRQ